MSNVAIDLTKTVKEIITTMKTAIDNLNTDVSSNKTAIDNLKGQILQAVYPVGSVYVSITDSRNPAAILGFGTWEALPAGYGLVAQGTATAEDGSKLTFTAGQKSGEFKHKITLGELHQNAIIWVKNTTSKDIECHGLDVGVINTAKPNDWCRAPKSNAIKAGFSCGGNEAINMLGPSIAAYCWKRTV
nr:MAG TPA: Baseplate structural protein [Caudoviricetes sp.]